MNFIVYDIEATCWEGTPRSLIQETIEIGAVLVSPYGEIESTFDSFIRPVLNPRLSYYCQNLTGIEQAQVNRAPKYPAVIEAFQDWAEIYEEDYVLCSWGNFDRRQLIQDCKLHKMEYDWVEEHINIKQQYKEIKRKHRVRGLRATVESEGFEFTGEHHRGIDDAENLAKIFIKYLDEWRY
ncbi:MAG: 3'-5' exonuclease [Bacteroidota bacterium]